MSRYFRPIVFSFLLLFLTGCATQRNVQLSENFWQSHKQKVTVAMTKPPKPGLYQVGNQGLLDYAISSAMNKTIDNHLSQTDLSWYKNMPSSFVAQLKQRNIKANALGGELDPQKKDYAAVARLGDSDKILVLKLHAFGARRTYYSFIPTGAPEAFVEMTGELINDRNEVLWRYKTTVVQAVDGTWDQPPNYPNLTNAVKLAIASAQQEVYGSFFSGH